MVERRDRKPQVVGSIPTLGSRYMRRAYSRLQSVEERRNLRKAILFIVLATAIIVLLVFVGVPLVGRLTVFISDLRGGGKAISKNDTIPPGSPRFNFFPAFTNQHTVHITGASEP